MPRFAAAFIAMAIVIAVVLVARSETGTDKPPGRTADAISKTNMYVDAVNRLADHIDKHGRILNPLSDEGK